MKTHFTKDEWRFNENDGCIRSHTKEIAFIVSQDDEAEEEANAKLMVASKDMLEALLALQDTISIILTGGNVDEDSLLSDYNLATEVIKKATE